MAIRLANQSTQAPWTLYTWQDPELLPVNWDAEPAGLDWATVCEAAGFSPDDEETGWAILEEEWNGHPAGAIVVTEATTEGHQFAVSRVTAEDFLSWSGYLPKAETV